MEKNIKFVSAPFIEKISFFSILYYERRNRNQY